MTVVQSLAVGSALVRAAKKRRRLADRTNAADRAYGELLKARYVKDTREHLEAIGVLE